MKQNRPFRFNRARSFSTKLLVLRAACELAIANLVAVAATSLALAQNLPPPAASNAFSAAPASGVLSWAVRDFKDQMTDKVTRKAVSERDFDDGVTLNARASCLEYGFEFDIDVFRGKDAAPYARKDDGIEIRLRIDGGDIRTAIAKASYANEAIIIFYDRAAMEKLMRSGNAETRRRTGILGAVDQVMIGTLLSHVDKTAAGTIAQLANAKGIRVELPLANGMAYVVDLNPQDQALKSIIQQCASDLRGQVAAQQRTAQQEREHAEHAAQQARERAERERVATAEANHQTFYSARKREWCVTTQQLITLRAASIRSIDEFNPRIAAGQVKTIDVPGGTKLLGLNEVDFAPPGAKIPADRCVVGYNGPLGRIVGTVQVNSLTTVANFEATDRAIHRP